MHGLPLGEILLRQRRINETQLARALDLQRKGGGRLGDILVAEGMTGYIDLYRAVATHYGLPFIDLLKEPPDPALLMRIDVERYLSLGALPWRRQDGQVCVALSNLHDDTLAWVRQHFDGGTTLAITSPFDIRRAVEACFATHIEDTSRLSLWRRFPQASARVTLLLRQKQILYALLAAGLLLAAHAPINTALAVIIFCHLIYGATMLFKCWLFALGTRIPEAVDWKKRLASLNEWKLPVYTVLVPMYREASSLPGLLSSMQRMDYPSAKLDIKLVLEADDKETLAAAKALKPRYQFDIIRVPPGEVRTKPRACNYALRFARGEYVTVFDADDRPERLQLKKAVYAFRHLSPDVACLQARLNYYNTNDNLLTRMFSLEYGILFNFMLYGLQRLSIPIPLGGTSNHIALARLRELGEWDPYNVTEDADLGVRLAARGFRTAMLDSFTMEEAPNRLIPWIRQRSRWIKGYMQTWLVHMRHPVALYRQLGWKGFIGFQFVLGCSSFAFLTAPLVWVLSLFWVGSVAGWHGVAFPAWLTGLVLGNLLIGVGTQWFCAIYCALCYRKYAVPVAIAALLYPLYLVLHSIASYKALWQLIVKPHFWEKTPHGLARHFHMAPPVKKLAVAQGF